jgi:hypothetical protein
MSTFVQTIAPTPYGFFDSDPAFQGEADATVTFVKRKLGDDVLQVELTKKQIWACLEEATCEYGKLVNEMQIKGELANILGAPTGSSGSVGYENRYLHKTLEFLMRQADPYASYAGVGGSYDSVLGYFQLESGRQDYNLYTELMHPTSGTTVAQSLPSGSRGKLRIIEVFHAEPLAAQHMLLNASNVTNFLATEFNYESYVNSTVFYVLPVFEDVLRRQMLETAFRVRRSNYSYEIRGSNIRIFPVPAAGAIEMQGNRLWVRVAGHADPLNTAYSALDDSTYGVSGPSNAPYGNIPFGTINSWGRQWIRQYAMALARELLGLVRSKMKSIPVPGGDLTLNGDDLVSQGREDKDKLRTELREFLDSVSQSKLIEQEATVAENIARQLKFLPMPIGRAIFVG